MVCTQPTRPTQCASPARCTPNGFVAPSSCRVALGGPVRSQRRLFSRLQFLMTAWAIAATIAVRGLFFFLRQGSGQDSGSSSRFVSCPYVWRRTHIYGTRKQLCTVIVTYPFVLVCSPFCQFTRTPNQGLLDLSWCRPWCTLLGLPWVQVLAAPLVLFRCNFVDLPLLFC